MKHNNYNLIHEILTINEMSTSKVLWRSTKQIGKGIKKQPLAGALIAVPIPGTAAMGTAMLSRDPSFIKAIKTGSGKLIHFNRPKAGIRKGIEKEKQRKKDMSKYLGFSKAIA